MPISQNTYTVPNNFVQQYDLGQKKIRADLVDENFTDAAGAINTLLTDDANTVHLTGAETVSGNKTFSGNNTFSGTNAFSGTTTAVTQSASDNSTKVATTAYADNAASTAAAAVQVVPVGSIIWSGKGSAPTGFLLCNGSAVSRTTYAALFAAIGTAFGSGDGSTTFNLPNLINKFIEGSTTAGTVKAAGLPEIDGTVPATRPATTDEQAAQSFTGPFALTNTLVINLGGGSNPQKLADFKASRANAIYGNSNTVQPPAVTAVPYIKY